MRVILIAAFFVAALGKVTVTKQPHVRSARTSKRGSGSGDVRTDTPPPCECKEQWTDSEGGGTCSDVQYGCPQSACDGDADRWCYTKVFSNGTHPGCATEEDLDGWSYCDDSNAPKEPSGNLLVISGSEYCTVNATSSCVTDGPEDYDDDDDDYDDDDDDEDCTISVLAGGRLVSDGFNTEQRYDVLTIDGTDYSGNDVDVNVRVAPGSTIKWTSDGSGVRSGWKICFVESGVYDIDAVCTTFKDCASLCCSDGLGQDCTSTEARSVTGSCCAPGTDDLCKSFEKCESDEDCAVDSHTCGIYGACGLFVPTCGEATEGGPAFACSDNQLYDPGQKAEITPTSAICCKDPPPPCECKVQWMESGDEGCGDVQFGCPQSACDDDVDRWCNIANPGCATDEDLDGWSYCDDSNAPKDCECKNTWNSPYDGPDCMHQEGCPSTPCDQATGGGDEPWCMPANLNCIAADPVIVINEEWMFCEPGITPVSEEELPHCICEETCSGSLSDAGGGGGGCAVSNSPCKEELVDEDGYKVMYCDAPEVYVEAEPTCKCRNTWDSLEDSVACKDVHGCPAQACDGHQQSWCMTTGYGDGDDDGDGAMCDHEWMFCDPCQGMRCGEGTACIQGVCEIVVQDCCVQDMCNIATVRECVSWFDGICATIWDSQCIAEAQAPPCNYECKYVPEQTNFERCDLQESVTLGWGRDCASFMKNKHDATTCDSTVTCQDDETTTLAELCPDQCGGAFTQCSPRGSPTTCDQYLAEESNDCGDKAHYVCRGPDYLPKPGQTIAEMCPLQCNDWGRSQGICTHIFNCRLDKQEICVGGHMGEGKGTCTPEVSFQYEGCQQYVNEHLIEPDGSDDGSDDGEGVATAPVYLTPFKACEDTQVNTRCPRECAEVRGVIPSIGSVFNGLYANCTAWADSFSTYSAGGYGQQVQCNNFMSDNIENTGLVWQYGDWRMEDVCPQECNNIDYRS